MEVAGERKSVVTALLVRMEAVVVNAGSVGLALRSAVVPVTQHR